jgi:hypothetical protein
MNALGQGFEHLHFGTPRKGVFWILTKSGHFSKECNEETYIFEEGSKKPFRTLRKRRRGFCERLDRGGVQTTFSDPLERWTARILCKSGPQGESITCWFCFRFAWTICLLVHGFLVPEAGNQIWLPVLHKTGRTEKAHPMVITYSS